MSLETDPRVGAARTWVSEGMKVWAPVKVENNRLMFAICDVVVAAGDHARVSNQRHGFDNWLEVRELHTYIPPQAVAILQGRA